MRHATRKPLEACATKGFLVLQVMAIDRIDIRTYRLRRCFVPSEDARSFIRSRAYPMSEAMLCFDERLCARLHEGRDGVARVLRRSLSELVKVLLEARIGRIPLSDMPEHLDRTIERIGPQHIQEACAMATFSAASGAIPCSRLRANAKNTSLNASVASSSFPFCRAMPASMTSFP